MMPESVRIDHEFITLGQFLKMTDAIESGGQAKMFLQQTNVLVDGEREFRRGRKLYKGMVVQVGAADDISSMPRARTYIIFSEG